MILLAYSQAPESMKSMCQASWLLTVAMGNFTVMVIASMRLFAWKSGEFLFFACLVLVAAVVFSAMAMRYTYVENRPGAAAGVRAAEEEVGSLELGEGGDDDDGRDHTRDPLVSKQD